MDGSPSLCIESICGLNVICGFVLEDEGRKATGRWGNCVLVRKTQFPVVWTVYFIFRYSRCTALKTFPG